jgi:hypothetical protein
MILEAILLAVFLGLAALVWALAPQIAELLLGAMGGERGAYFFLVELPTADATATGTIGPAVTNVFELMRNVAFVFFAVVLVVAGLCYALESFRVMGEGTAANIITGSFFTLIAIFLVIPLYNAVAGLLNFLTSPGSGAILQPGMIQKVIEVAMRPPAATWQDQVVSFFMAVFFLIMVAVSLIAVGILGTLRIFFVGACLAIMPLLLVMRLIPLTRRIGESFIEMLIGLMVASLMSAIFLRFGFEVVNQWTGLMATVAAVGTLIAAAMIPTVLAPRLGGLFMTAAGVTTAAISTAAGATAVIAGGAALGATTGLLHGLAAPASMVTPLAGSRTLGRAGLALRGALLGAGAGAGSGLKSAFTGGLTMGLGGLAVPSPQAVTRGLASGTGAAHGLSHDFLAKRAGSAAGALLQRFAEQPFPGEDSHLGLEWYNNEVANRPAEDVGRSFASKLGLEDKLKEEKAHRMLGQTVQGFLDEHKSSPEKLDRVRLWLDKFEGMSPQERAELVSGAVAGAAAFGSPLVAQLSALDRDPSRFSGLFSSAVMGEPGLVAKARLYQLTRLRFKPSRLSDEEGENFAKEILGWSAEKKAEWINKSLHVKIPKGQESRAARHLGEYLKNLRDNYPKLLHNLKLNLSEFSKSPKAKHTSPRSVTRALKANAPWLEKRLGGKPPKVDLEKVKPKGSLSVNVGEFFRNLARQTFREVAGAKRKRGEIIARGSGPAVTQRELADWVNKTWGRKRGRTES